MVSGTVHEIERLPPSAPRLGARLRTLAEVVPLGARVADVGTDHALLLAWLWRAARIEHGIGIDVAPGALAQARRTLETTATQSIELRRGHGLSPLRPDEVDTVVLAGMGGARMMRLVDAAPSVVARLERLILQPNTGWTALRRWIAQHRWPLVDERIVQERGKSYVVLTVDPHPGPELGWDDDALELGPRLLIERPPAFKAWLQDELQRTRRALRGAQASQTPGDDSRANALRTRMDRLERALGLTALAT